MFKQARTRGFTLIELLIVMSIIALLVCILVPTITKAVEVVKKYRTLHEFKELGIAIQSFRTDWGDYPPSKPYDGTASSGAMPTGAANLAYYLCGPGVCVPGGTGGGWGTAGGGAMPFTAPAAPTRAYGPYYQVDQEYLGYEKTGSNTSVLVGFLDFFKGGYWDMGSSRFVPRGLILYWKFDAAAPTQSTNYNVVENGPATDTTGLANYKDQASFTEAVIMSAYVGIGVDLGDPNKWHWPRDDYLLASPGPDGRYGYTKTNADGTIGPALSSDAGTTCDDIFN